MSVTQVWIIGAALECDIVADNSAVSGKHCRLSQTGMGFEIEDLGSTNGTFINGNRCEGKVGVTQQDSITLGQTFPFPWPETVAEAPRRESPAPRSTELHSVERRTIRIGRLPDNDLVLDYAQMSGHHAKIVIEGDQATIEDLGSTNGTAVSTAENRITQAVSIEPNDTVFFGSLRFIASELTDPDKPVEPVDGTELVDVGALLERQGAAGFSGRRNPYRIAAMIGGPLLLLLLIGLALWPDSPPPEEGPHPAMRAIYTVLATNPESGQSCRFGTAWAIDEHHLVSTAQVIATVAKMKEIGFTAITVECPAIEESSFTVVNMRSHPEFAAVTAEADRLYHAEATARQQAEYLQGLLVLLDREIPNLDNTPESVQKIVQELEVEGLNASPQPKTFEALMTRMGDLIKTVAGEGQSAQTDLQSATDRIVFLDIGVLEVDGTLPATLEVAASESASAGNSTVALIGIPFDQDDPWVDPDFPRQSLLNAGALASREISEEAEELHLRISCDRNLNMQHRAGSPVLDESGKVLALFVRPTPNYERPVEPPTGQQYDAVEVSQFLDFLKQK